MSEPPRRPPPLRRPARPLTDGIVTLDAFTRGDVLAIVAAIDDEILRWLPLPDPYGEAEARAFVTAPANTAPAGDALNWAIRSPGGDGTAVLAGSIGVSAPSGTSAPQMGYWITPGARGRGVACRAVRLLAGYVLSGAGVDRVEILTHPGNLASRRVAERAGARFVGLRPGGLVPPASDGSTDAAVYALPCGPTRRRRRNATGSR